jgi:hypothetical protein
MEIKPGNSYLVTLKEEFLAPDGILYKSAFGIASEIVTEGGKILTTDIFLGGMIIPENLILCAIHVDDVDLKIKKIYFADY